MNASMTYVTEETLRDLLKEAARVSRFAYCPYSRFAVGAAVLSASGNVYVGCNVENAAYSPGICAERNAVGNMVSHGEQHFVAAAVYTETATPTAPCGVCRQVLNEFSPQAHVICGCAGTALLVTEVRLLLPDAFGPHNLIGAAPDQGYGQGRG